LFPGGLYQDPYLHIPSQLYVSVERDNHLVSTSAFWLHPMMFAGFLLRVPPTNVLLLGHVGAGKSTFVNNAGSALVKDAHRKAVSAPAIAERSFTLELQRHQLDGTPWSFYDTVGFNPNNPDDYSIDCLRFFLRNELPDKFVGVTVQDLMQQFAQGGASVSSAGPILAVALIFDVLKIEDEPTLKFVYRVIEAAKQEGMQPIFVATHLGRSTHPFPHDEEGIARAQRASALLGGQRVYRLYDSPDPEREFEIRHSALHVLQAIHTEAEAKRQALRAKVVCTGLEGSCDGNFGRL